MKKIITVLLVAVSCSAWSGNYEDGVAAFEIKDYSTAVIKFRAAAEEEGNAGAQAYLGFMHQQGQAVIQDYVLSVRWFKLAAEQGHAGAQMYLGLMYGGGLGVKKNYVKAHMWSNLATANGNKLAVNDRNEVAKVMTEQQIAEAQKLARECQARNYKNCD